MVKYFCSIQNSNVCERVYVGILTQSANIMELPLMWLIVIKDNKYHTHVIFKINRMLKKQEFFQAGMVGIPWKHSYHGYIEYLYTEHLAIYR